MLLEGAEYVRDANISNLAFAMIETRAALDNLDEIMSVDGLDGIYIGPSDLAYALGYSPHFDTEEPELVDVALHILECAKAHKLIAAIHTNSPEYGRKMADKGFNFITAGSDFGMLSEGARRVVDTFKGRSSGSGSSGY